MLQYDTTNMFSPPDSPFFGVATVSELAGDFGNSVFFYFDALSEGIIELLHSTCVEQWAAITWGGR